MEYPCKPGYLFKYLLIDLLFSGLFGVLINAKAIKSFEKQAAFYRDNIVPLTSSLRSDIDELETIIPSDVWPVPTYSELLLKL